jgi:hypothetical protein
VAEKIRKTRKSQALSGRVRLQMPMVALKFTEWEALMRKRISREIEKRVVAEASRKRRARLDRTEIRKISSVLFPDLERLLTDALSIHIYFYGQVANAEAGFDLGLKPHHVIFGEPTDYAVVFATINADVCARLLEFEGARRRLTYMTEVRRERYKTMGITSTEFEEDEAIMDLLVSALPYTTQTIGMSKPSEIIDRAFENRLGQFEVPAKSQDAPNLLRLAGVPKDMGQVAKVCQNILSMPSLVPQRVAQAATRLMHSFGARDFGSIDHRDFDQYLKAATRGPRADSWKFDGASEIACYDINVLGMIAFWHGQHASYERVKVWLRPYMELIGRVPS